MYFILCFWIIFRRTSCEMNRNYTNLNHLSLNKTDFITEIWPKITRNSIYENQTGSQLSNLITYITPGLNILIRKLENNYFDANTTQCFQDVKKVLYDILEEEDYALKILDAGGKIVTGITHGNFFWLGSYDVCRHIIKEPLALKPSFNGLYCTTQLTIKGLDSSPLLGLCVPDSCNESLVTDITNIGLKELHPIIRSTVNNTICETPRKIDAGTYAGIVLLIILGILITSATFYDYFKNYFLQISTLNTTQWELEGLKVNNEIKRLSTEDEKKQSVQKYKRYYPKINFMKECLICFSILKSLTNILKDGANAADPPESIWVIHGTRALSMWWIILYHTNWLSTDIVENNYMIPKYYQNFAYQAITSGSFSMEGFFTFGGTFVGYSVTNDMQQSRGKVNWLLYYLNRFCILSPTYMLVLMINAVILPHLAYGPLFMQREIDQTAQACRSYWWAHFLYINNWLYIKTDQKCMPWTLYLANETLYFVISPVLLIILYKNKKIGFILIGGIMLMSMCATGMISALYGLPVGLGTSASESHTDLAYDYIFHKPYCRISPYMIGILNGYFLSSTKCQLRMKLWIRLLGWSCFYAIGLIVIYGMFMSYQSDSSLSNWIRAIYNATSRSFWALAVCWVIFICASGQGGLVNKFLRWRLWLVLSRINFCAYLLHPMVVFISYRNRFTPVYYQDINLVYMYIGNLVLTYLAALCVSISVEQPCIRLKKFILQAIRNRKMPINKTTEN